MSAFFPSSAAGLPLASRLQPWRQALHQRSRRCVGSEARRSAAVLLTLFETSEGLSSLFITRAAHLKRHPGQVALPGGMQEGDEDAFSCALREAEEEVGLPAEGALALGLFDELYSPYGTRLIPVVAWLPQIPQWRLDPGEVAAVHELPLAAFLAPGAHWTEQKEVPELGLCTIHHYQVAGVHVWGVTGHILYEWMSFLAQEVGGHSALLRHLKAGKP